MCLQVTYLCGAAYVGNMVQGTTAELWTRTASEQLRDRSDETKRNDPAGLLKQAT